MRKREGIEGDKGGMEGRRGRRAEGGSRRLARDRALQDGADLGPRNAEPSHGAEEPNLAERLVAQVGAWALACAERLNPPNGPFFTSDGRLLADTTLFAPPEEATERPTL